MIIQPCRRLWFLALLILAMPVRIAAGAEPAATPTGSLAAALQPFVDSYSLAGAVVLVADKQQTLRVETVGYADVAARRSMPADALFWIASQSKPITATALMMLVDEGKVDVEDPVEKYLPEFKALWLTVEQDNDHLSLKRPKRPIAVRDILSHTSGLPFKSAMEQPTLDLLPLRVAALSYAMTPLQFEPGAKYQYSNAGINTAGRIIEVVSGMPYEDFLAEQLFEPLGMKDTTFWPNEEQLSRLARSYRPNAAKNDLEEIPIGQLKYPLSDRNRQPMPAGGLFSTAADVARFCQMIFRGGEWDGKRYLSQQAVEQMTSKQTGELPQAYGFGWATGGGTFGHGGAHATNMTIAPQQGLIAIFMVQHAGFPGNGKESLATFQKAAYALYGKQR
jgi:CubicO group peptidase (beta-lactamase class C family)